MTVRLYAAAPAACHGPGARRCRLGSRGLPAEPCVGGADGDDIAVHRDCVGGDEVDRSVAGLQRYGGGPDTAAAGHGEPVFVWEELVEIPGRAIGAAVVHREDAAVFGHAAIGEEHRQVEAGAVAHGVDFGGLEPAIGTEELLGEEGGADGVVGRFEVPIPAVAAIGNDVGAKVGQRGAGTWHVVGHPVVRAGEAEDGDTSALQTLPVLAHIKVVGATKRCARVVTPEVRQGERGSGKPWGMKA